MGLSDHLAPGEFRRVPPGPCGCHALHWSAAHPRPHDPALCARWRKGVITSAEADELQGWFERSGEQT